MAVFGALCSTFVSFMKYFAILFNFIFDSSGCKYSQYFSGVLVKLLYLIKNDIQ